MSLGPGTRLGPYEILGALGAGGMGEVFRARDTKLGREVAVKVLPADLATDADRLARFEREAKTLAALNHPHIAQVYGFEEAPGLQALVLELVPGESLAARIARGPVPLGEALELGRQIALGLEAAHEKGIIHRDLKPANVQVTPDGVAKVLDFGLAKAPGGATVTPDVTASPTALGSGPLTAAGIVLGTAAYMSPEQARGLPVDARTDVWAFGALMFEMLTGRRPFPGPTVTDLLAQVLERDPDWSMLPVTTPAPVRALVQRCLRKEPKQRLHDIADARFVLEDALAALAQTASGVSATTGAQTSHPAPPAGRTRPLARLVASLALVLAGAVAGGFLWSRFGASPTPAREPQYLSLMLPPEQEMVLGGLAISPDGHSVVYSAVAEEGAPGPEGNAVRLFHRRLNERTAHPMAGTDHPWNVAFSPDGAWVAFTSKLDNKLKKIALSGGGTVDVADVPWLTGQPDRADWSEPGRILLGDPNGPVRSYPASGGEADIVVPREALEADEQGAITAIPMATPGRTLFFTTSAIAYWADGKRHTLPLKGAARPRRFGSYLLFWRVAGQNQQDLSAVGFDWVRGEVIGDPVSLLSEGGGTAPFEMSETGTLVYRASRAGASPRRLTWLVRADSPPPSLPVNLPPTVLSPRLSPDGRSLLYSGWAGTAPRLVVTDLDTGNTRVVSAGRHSWAVWTPDGRRVIYQVPPDWPGGAGLLARVADGSAGAERLTTSTVWQQPQVVSHDGRFLIYQEGGGVGTRTSAVEDNYDLWLLPLAPRAEPRPLLKTAANERLAHLSPDDRWMAYVSDESGRDEIWVRPFPDGTAAIQVSQDGGTEPVWAPDGRTLYYRDRTGSRLSAVPVTWGTVPQFGVPVVTSGHWEAGLRFGRLYDIHPDGRALLFVTPALLGREIRVVLHFDEVIRRKLAEATPR